MSDRESAAYIISLDYFISLENAYFLREIYEAIVRYYSLREIDYTDSSYEYDEIKGKHRYIFVAYTSEGELFVSESTKLKILANFNLEEYINMKLVSTIQLVHMTNIPESTLYYKPWGVISSDLDRDTIRRIRSDVKNIAKTYHVLPKNDTSIKAAMNNKAYYDVFMDKYLIIKRDKLHDVMKDIANDTLLE